MILLSYLIFLVKLLFYPLRLALFIIHRFLVFVSKPGAAIIVPVSMLALGFLLRSNIDALAGGMITDAFWDWRESSPELFDYRIEITFALGFLLTYLTLLFAGRLATPVVGAIPAPRAPIFPRPPLIVREHKISAVKASLAIGGTKSRFKGELKQLDRYLPPRALAVLGAGGSAPEQDERAPEPRRQPERERDDPQPSPELQQVQGERSRSPQSAKEAKPKRKEQGSTALPEAVLQAAQHPPNDPAPQILAEDLTRLTQTPANGALPASKPEGATSEPQKEAPATKARSSGPRRPPRQAARPASSPENEKGESAGMSPEVASASPRRSGGPMRPPRVSMPKPGHSEREP